MILILNYDDIEQKGAYIYIYMYIYVCVCVTLPHLTKMTERLKNDLVFMKLAIEQAQKALDSAEVPVGCVFVQNNEVIGAGHNDTNRSQNSTRHAELCAIDRILQSKPKTDFANCDLYVTVEPCIMCASALRQVGIRTVYFGAGNERFGGCGSVLAINRDKPDESLGKPYAVYPNLMRKDAVLLLRKFYTQENPTAPQPKTKKQRIVKDDIPPIDFRLYMDRDTFADYYGQSNISEYDSGNCVSDLL